LFEIALICTTIGRIPPSAKENQGREKDDLIPPWGLVAGLG
jgi:hypothetical protein